MSAEEFWKDDPQLFISYRTSFINKKKRELEENDYKSWLQGLYIYDGNGKLMVSLKQHISNIISKLFKGRTDVQEIPTYPAKPYMELKKEQKIKEEENKRNKKYKEYENSLMYFGTLKQQYIEKMKKKGE